MHIYIYIHSFLESFSNIGHYRLLSRVPCGIWASLVAQMIRNLPAMRETWVQSLALEHPLEKRTGYPLQYSGLENSMNRGAWQATVHGVTKSGTQLSNFHSVHVNLKD